MNKFYLYIYEEEEIGEIIEKIRKEKGKEVILVIPEKTKALSHPVNLEILKKEANNLNKKIYFSTDDKKIINLARQYGFDIFLSDVEEVDEKIFDIKPPKKKQEAQVFRQESQPKVLTQPRININWKKIFSYLLGFAVLVILVFIGFQILQTRAEIIIETEKTNFEIDEVITLSKDQVLPDLENKILPAEYVKVDLIKTETVTTTGQIFTGEMPLLKVVFLNYLEQEIPLAMGTRLVFNNNIFKTTEKIVIPPAQNDEPGQREVNAILTSIKDENLKIKEGTSLKIAAWEENKTRTKDGRLFTDVVKAKTAENYDSSSVAKIGSVDSEDITNVKLKLEDSLKKAVASNLAIKNSQSFYVYEPSLVKIDILNISHKVGDKTDKISATGKAFYETMKTSKEDFNDFIKNLINKEILSQEKQLIISQLNIDKVELLDFDSNKKIMTVGVKGQAILLPDTNPEKIKEALRGKTIDSVKEYFKMPGIDKVTIKIFPQWKETLPSDPQRIKITIK